MKIDADKVYYPLTVEIKLDYSDIAEWFKTARSDDIKKALNEIGLALSENEEENPFFGFSRKDLYRMLSPKSKDFWKSLIKELK